MPKSAGKMKIKKLSLLFFALITITACAASFRYAWYGVDLKKLNDDEASRIRLRPGRESDKELSGIECKNKVGDCVLMKKADFQAWYIEDADQRKRLEACGDK